MAEDENFQSVYETFLFNADEKEKKARLLEHLLEVLRQRYTFLTQAQLDYIKEHEGAHAQKDVYGPGHYIILERIKGEKIQVISTYEAGSHRTEEQLMEIGHAPQNPSKWDREKYPKQ